MNDPVDTTLVEALEHAERLLANAERHPQRLVETTGQFFDLRIVRPLRQAVQSDCQHQWANHPGLPSLGPLPERDSCLLCGLVWPPTRAELRAALAAQPRREVERVKAMAEIEAGQVMSLSELRRFLGL